MTKSDWQNFLKSNKKIEDQEVDEPIVKKDKKEKIDPATEVAAEVHIDSSNVDHENETPKSVPDFSE